MFHFTWSFVINKKHKVLLQFFIWTPETLGVMYISLGILYLNICNHCTKFCTEKYTNISILIFSLKLNLSEIIGKNNWYYGAVLCFPLSGVSFWQTLMQGQCQDVMKSIQFWWPHSSYGLWQCIVISINRRNLLCRNAIRNFHDTNCVDVTDVGGWHYALCVSFVNWF